MKTEKTGKTDKDSKTEATIATKTRNNNSNKSTTTATAIRKSANGGGNSGGSGEADKGAIRQEKTDAKQCDNGRKRIMNLTAKHPPMGKRAEGEKALLQEEVIPKRDATHRRKRGKSDRRESGVAASKQLHERDARNLCAHEERGNDCHVNEAKDANMAKLVSVTVLFKTTCLNS